VREPTQLDLFIINSPLQFLNALEARRHFDIQSEHAVLVLLADDSRDTPAQIRRMLNPKDWKRICSAGSLPNTTSLLSKARHMREQIRELNKVANEMPRLHRVFLGNYLAHGIMHLANQLKATEFVLLDDGNATLAVNDQRHLLSLGGKKSCNLKSSRFSVLVKRLLGLRFQDIPSLTLFTAYKLTPADSDRVVRHGYEALRARMTGMIQTNEVFFLGAPLVELGFVSDDYYHYSLRRVRESIKPRKLVYIPHRRESAVALEKLRKQLGVEVRYLGVAVEYFLCHSPELPAGLVSFFSSALLNCHIIFGQLLTVQAFRITPSEVLTTEQSSAVENIYAYFRQYIGSGFEVVDIDNLPGC
jgi:hypothetical protein